MRGNSDTRPPSAVLERASLVLSTLEATGRLTFMQIVRRTGLHRTSVHRILENLVELGWRRRNRREYELGCRLAELGYLAIHQDRLHRAARPFLWDPHEATGFVVSLEILDGVDAVYLDTVGGRTPNLATGAGRRTPAHTSAIGPRRPPEVRRIRPASGRGRRVPEAGKPPSRGHALTVSTMMRAVPSTALRSGDPRIGWGRGMLAVGDQGNLAGGQRHSMRITTKTIPGQHLWSDSRHRARSSSRMRAARSSSDGNCLHHAQCANAFGAVNRSADRETVMRVIA